MILGTIQSYKIYRHVETSRVVEINSTDLLIKTDREWQQSVRYTLRDSPDNVYQEFAVPLDDFRVRFEEYTPEMEKAAEAANSGGTSSGQG